MEADKNINDILARLVELIHEDPELHEAVVSLINAKAAHERELANVARARKTKLELANAARARKMKLELANAA